MVEASTSYPTDENQSSARDLLSPVIGFRIGDTTGVDFGIQHLVKGGMIDLDIEKVSYGEIWFKNVNVQLVDDIFWAEGTAVQLYIGYANRPDRTLNQGTFRMTNPKFEFGGKQRIVMSGLGDGGDMTNQAKRRVFENMTYDRIVEEIAGEYGYETLITGTLKDSIPSVTQAGITDYAFLRELALRAGTDFFVFNNKLFFMIPALKSDEESIIVDVASDGVKSVVFSVMGIGRSGEIISSPINPLTGDFEVVTSEIYSDGIFDVEAESQIRAVNLAQPRITYVDGRGNLLTKGALQTMLDTEANKRKFVVKVRATIDGLEQLAPRQMVMFLNAGLRFTGPYYITHVTHNVKQQGMEYTTTFEGERATTFQYQRTVAGAGQDTVGGTPEPMMDVSGSSESEVA